MEYPWLETPTVHGASPRNPRAVCSDLRARIFAAKDGTRAKRSRRLALHDVGAMGPRTTHLMPNPRIAEPRGWGATIAGPKEVHGSSPIPSSGSPGPVVLGATKMTLRTSTHYHSRHRHSGPISSVSCVLDAGGLGGTRAVFRDVQVGEPIACETARGLVWEGEQRKCGVRSSAG